MKEFLEYAKSKGVKSIDVDTLVVISDFFESEQSSLTVIKHKRTLLRDFCEWAYRKDDDWSISDIDIENYLK
jgi:hypothetical protein